MVSDRHTDVLYLALHIHLGHVLLHIENNCLYCYHHASVHLPRRYSDDSIFFISLPCLLSLHSTTRAMKTSLSNASKIFTTC